AIAGAVSAHAIQAAPAGLAGTITAAALSGTAVTTTAAIAATKAFAMTTIQKIAITTALAIAVGTGIYEVRDAANARAAAQALQQQPSTLSEQVARLGRALEDAKNQLAAAQSQNDRLNGDTAELLRLRAEVGGLRQRNNELEKLRNEKQTSPQEPLTDPQIV